MTAFEITSIFESFCSEHGLSVELNWDMPFGYKTAYGTYDVTINTLLMKNIGPTHIWVYPTNKTQINTLTNKLKNIAA